MMDKTFIGLIRSQIDAIDSCDAPADANINILEAVKLLLDNIDSSNEVLSTYDKYTIRRLFAAYGETGKKICAFYDTAKPHLDPAALNGTIGSTISETNEKINRVGNAFSELEEKEDALLRVEKELTELNAQYRLLNEKVASLRAVRETVSDDVITSLKNERTHLEAEIKASTKAKEAADAQKAELQMLYNEVEKIRVETDSDCGKIKTSILEFIDGNRDQISALYENGSADVDRIRAEIEEYIRLYDNLDDAAREYAQTREFYEKWLGENSALVENMRKNDIKSAKQIAETISSAKADAEAGLKAYDAVLQKILSDEQDIRKAVERRQGKNVLST